MADDQIKEIAKRLLDVERGVNSVQLTLARMEQSMTDTHRRVERCEVRLDGLEDETRDLPDIRRRVDKHGEHHSRAFARLDDVALSRAKALGMIAGIAAVAGTVSAIIQAVISGWGS